MNRTKDQGEVYSKRKNILFGKLGIIIIFYFILPLRILISLCVFFRPHQFARFCPMNTNLGPWGTHLPLTACNASPTGIPQNKKAVF